MTEVRNIHKPSSRAVVAELKRLLVLAMDGEIIGMGYAVMSKDQVVRAGLSGVLAKNKAMATSAFFTAAINVAQRVTER